jgi:hypothetical protein
MSILGLLTFIKIEQLELRKLMDHIDDRLGFPQILRRIYLIIFIVYKHHLLKI